MSALRRAQAEVPVTARGCRPRPLTPWRAALLLLACARRSPSRAWSSPATCSSSATSRRSRWGRLEALRPRASPRAPGRCGTPSPASAGRCSRIPAAQVLYPFDLAEPRAAAAGLLRRSTRSPTCCSAGSASSPSRAASASRCAGGLLAGALFLLAGPLLSVTSLWQHLAGRGLGAVGARSPASAALARPRSRRTHSPGARPSPCRCSAGSLDYVLLGGAGAGGARRASRARRIARRAAARDGPALRCSAARGARRSACPRCSGCPALELLRAAVARASSAQRARVLWSLRPALLLQALAPVFPHDLPLGAGGARDASTTAASRSSPRSTSAPPALPLVARRSSSAAAPTLAVLLASLGLGARRWPWGGTALAFFWARGRASPGSRLFRYPAKTLVLGRSGVGAAGGASASTRGPAPRGPCCLAAAAGGARAIALGLASRCGAEAPAWPAAGWARTPSGDPCDSLLAPVALSPVFAAALAAALAAAAHPGLGPRPGTGRALAVATLATAVAISLSRTATPRGLGSRARGSRARPASWRPRSADGAERLHVVRLRGRSAGRTGPGWKPDEPKEPPGPPRLGEDAAACRRRSTRSTASRWGVRGGFGSDVAELELARAAQPRCLVRFHQEDGPPSRPAPAARGRDAPRRAPPGGPRGLRAASPRYARPHVGDAFLLRVPGTLPRAYAAEGARAASGRAAYDALLDPAFDPRARSCCRRGAATAARDGFAGEARARGRGVRTASGARGAVSTGRGIWSSLEGFDRGWRARVDGRAAELRRANGRLPARCRSRPAATGWSSSTGRRGSVAGAASRLALARAAAGFSWPASRPREGRRGGPPPGDGSAA